MNLKLSEITERRTITFLSRNRNKITIVLFVIFTSVMCTVFSFMIPFGQTPDEPAHYQMIEQEFGTTGYYDEICEKLWVGGGYYHLPFNIEGKVADCVDPSTSQVHFDKELSITDFHLSPLALRHLPMGIGFYLGIALDLPIIVCTHLAEIFAIVFYIVMGCLTIRIVPIKKEIFAFCLLIPETIHQCSSVNYDAILIPCCIFLFAYILHLFYREENIKWKNMAIIALVTIVIALIKVPYITIAMTLFLIPVSHYELRIGRKDGKNIEIASFVRKFWYVAVIVAILLVCVCIYLGRENSLIKTLMSDILELPSFLKFLYRTYEDRIYAHLQQMVGVFGWVDSWVSNQYIILFFGMMVYLNVGITEHVDNRLSFKRRIALLVFVTISLVLIEIAMQSWNYVYYGWDTTVGLEQYRQYVVASDVNTGVQGRYFIPLLPMILVALSGTIERKRTAKYILIQILFYSLTAIRLYSILKIRYWAN